MKKISIIIGIVIIAIGAYMLAISFNKDNNYKKEDNKALDIFFNEYNEKVQDKDIKENGKTKKNDFISYNAVIEVPNISLKTGIVMSDKTFKSMDRNVSIYPSSDMPDVKGGNFILFAHSGNARVSYFKNIDKLKIGNEIKVYYNKTEYEYKVIKKYDISQDDDTPLSKMKDKTIITLITCTKNNDDYRTIVVGELK